MDYCEQKEPTMAVRYIYHDQEKGEKLALSSNETGLRVSVESAFTTETPTPCKPPETL